MTQTTTQTLTSLWEIARNTLSVILRSRVLLLALILASIVLIFVIRSLPTIQMATEAGELDYLRSLQNSIVNGLFGFWTQATFALALVFGATALPSEISAGTIVPVLAKPVERWHFLAGKWLGVQIFILAFELLGLLIIAVVLQVYGAEVSLLFWIGATRFCLLAIIMGSAALALSTVASPFLAGLLPVFFSVMNAVAADSVGSPNRWTDLVARGYRLLMPAPMPQNLLSAGFDMDLVNPEYGLYFQILLENALYAVALLAFASLVFSLRELRLR